MTPRCLVLLAAYNGRAFIEEQVRSILDQRGVSVHVLISVDCSTDGTEAIVDALALADPRVSVLPHNQRFGGAAANFFRLIECAQLQGHDFFSLADQDDIWLPEKLARAVEVLQQRQVAGYSSDVLAFWPTGRELVVKKSQPQTAYDYLFEAAGPGCTYVLNGELMAAVQANVRRNAGALGGVTLHDWYIYAFARANGYRWHIDEHLLMRYRQHASNQVGVNTGLGAFRARLSKVFDGWWLGQACLIAQQVGMASDPFVEKWMGLKRRALIGLALHGRQCRRRPRDKIIFAALCMALAVKGVRK